MIRLSALIICILGLIGDVSAQSLATIRVGWTIPDGEAKYWMLRRPDDFPGLGKTYKVEWQQVQGTSVSAQALAAGAYTPALHSAHLFDSLDSVVSLFVAWCRRISGDGPSGRP